MQIKLIIFFLFVSNTLYSQFYFQWYNTYNPNHYFDDAAGIVQDSLGNTYVTGRSFGLGRGEATYDIATIKYGVTGNTLWARRYNYQDPQISYEEAVNIILSKDGNLLIGGNGYVSSRSTNSMVLLKYDLSGNILWSARYFDSAYSYGTELSSFIEDNTGSIYICGFSEGSSVEGSAAQLVKFDSNGKFIWKKSYKRNQSSQNYFRAISLDNSVNVFVTGQTKDKGVYWSDFLIVKFDSSGNQLWTKVQSEEIRDYGYSVGNDANGNCYIAGYSYVTDTIAYFKLLKCNQSGVLQWIKTYPSRYDNSWKVYSYFIPELLKVDQNGNSFVNFTSFYSGRSKIALGQFDSNGNEIWLTTYDGNVNKNESRDFKITSDGKIYAIGESLGDSNSSYVILELDLLGKIKKIIRNEGQIPYRFDPIALSAFKNSISVAGVIYPSGPTTQITTVNYSTVIGIHNTGLHSADDFALYQNFPNPFNPSTKIKFSVPGNEGRNVKLVVYNFIGSEVMTLVNERLNPGTYEVDFKGSGLSSGVYFYKLVAGNFSETKRMVLIK